MPKESFATDKFLFTCLLVLVAFYFALDQCGAWDWASNRINTGAAGATYRGMTR